jgi:hypothetical protein
VLRRLLTLLLVSTALGCGGSGSTPTPVYVRTTSTATVTGFQARSTACVGFQNARAGEVDAYVTPDTIIVALVAGSCDAPGQVIAEKAGNVNADAPAGANHLRLTNPTDATVNYTLSLTHWY